jgi:hypothetical protein
MAAIMTSPARTRDGRLTVRLAFPPFAAELAPRNEMLLAAWAGRLP